VGGLHHECRWHECQKADNVSREYHRYQSCLEAGPIARRVLHEARWLNPTMKILWGDNRISIMKEKEK
jgi:hypothetical protein